MDYNQAFADSTGSIWTRQSGNTILVTLIVDGRVQIERFDPEGALVSSVGCDNVGSVVDALTGLPLMAHWHPVSLTEPIITLGKKGIGHTLGEWNRLHPSKGKRR